MTRPRRAHGRLRLGAAVATAVALLGVPAAPAVAAACSVGGAIGEYWRSIGGERSFLGGCTTGELTVPGGVVQHFQRGSVYWSTGTGAREVHGAIRDTYDRGGGPASALRLPVTHETRTPYRPGAFNHFQGGSIYWSLGTGAHVVRGAIRGTWAATGWENGVLGFPVTSERPTPVKPGAYSHFQGGSVYWSSGTGAHVVRGAIRDAWAAGGWENGVLGFPVTSEQPTPVKHGAYSHFQGGSVYWSPGTGAHEVRGAIRHTWAAAGWENGSLGFPVTDEYAVPGGRRSDFEGGSVVWDAQTGATRTVAGPRPAFAFTVSGVSAADLPHSYRAGCPVGPAQLRLLRLSHVGFDGRDHTGELVVHERHVLAVLRAFERMHRARFAVERMQRVDVYFGSDDASMDANNTSGFNCRKATGSSTWSEHAYGAAIDVNPVQNPYVSGSTVSPEAGRAYLDRSHVRTGMVVSGDAVVRGFLEQGWGWGGYWSRSKDYQHFSASGR